MLIANIILVLLAILIGIVYLNIFYFFFLAVPSLSSKNKIVEKILKSEIDFGQNKKFYDLGCGNGKVISRIAEKYPDMHCVGIESNPGIYWWALLRKMLTGEKFTCLRGNFFKIDLQDADIIFIYLAPAINRKLEIKFKQELKAGAIVISNSFPIKSQNPWKVIPGIRGALDTLYIYKY